MIVEYIRYSVPPEQATHFEQTYEKAADYLLASPHCLGYDVARCVDEPASYIVRIHWDSAAGHIGGFRSSPRFRSFFELVKPFFPDIAEMRHYDLVGEHPRT
ncbi:MAG TPA: antibiotic biosynthesis monooxygenase family protein [Pseudonocardiaceae bacterium]|nr:antibiotic biosynthesis monooxygenase family protein [Pseudonocardiaceae bacterium]